MKIAMKFMLLYFLKSQKKLQKISGFQVNALWYSKNNMSIIVSLTRKRFAVTN